jgi:quercetin dioxygenase-like cupin family protein
MQRLKHKVGTFDAAAMAPPSGFDGHATGLTVAPFVDHADETVHMAYGLMRLVAGGETDIVLQSYELALYLLNGGIQLYRNGRIHTLAAGDIALIPTGTEYALRNKSETAAEWIAMAAPQPKPPGGWQDTWFTGAADWMRPAAAADLRDPRNRLLGHFDPASLPPPATVHSDLHGFAIKFLMDREFGAVHFNMFVVDFADGGLCNHHDHPFEEAYFILDGEVDITFDGIDYTLKKGDYAWTGVGAQHAFFPKKGQPVRWLEVQAPQPPAQGGMRWYAQWDYITTVLRD